MDWFSFLLGMIPGALGSLALWILIGRPLIMKYAGKSVIDRFKEPDDDLLEAIDCLMTHLWKWLNTPQIEAPGPPTEDGNPTTVKISPLQNVMGLMIQDIVFRISNKIFGHKGKIQQDANRMEAAIASQMGLSLPRKGQSTSEFLMEQLANRMMPKIEEKLNNILDNKQGGSGKDEWR